MKCSATERTHVLRASAVKPIDARPRQDGALFHRTDRRWPIVPPYCAMWRKMYEYVSVLVLFCLQQLSPHGVGYDMGISDSFFSHWKTVSCHLPETPRLPENMVGAEPIKYGALRKCSVGEDNDIAHFVREHFEPSDPTISLNDPAFILIFSVGTSIQKPTVGRRKTWA